MFFSKVDIFLDFCLIYWNYWNSNQSKGLTK